MDYKALANSALAERARLVNEARSVNDDTTLGDAEKRERIERINTDIEAKTADARSLIEQGEREAEVRDLGERMGRLTVPVDAPVEGPVDAESEAFRAVGRGEARSANVTLASMPSPTDLRAFAASGSAGTGNVKLGLGTAFGTAAQAGTLIQGSLSDSLLSSLLWFSPILKSGARVITTENGAPMDWPFRGSSRITAAKVAEGAAYGKAQDTFSRVSLNSYKYGVLTQASLEMLDDTKLPLAALLGEDLGYSLALATAVDFAKGTGTNQPQGLVTGTTQTYNVSTLAAMTTDDVISIQYALTPPYRANGVYYMSDTFAQKVRLFKDTQGRYIWQDALNGDQPDKLLGRAVYIDPNLDAVAAGAGKAPVLFGDLSKFLIRFASGVTITRSDEYGFDSDIVAWKASVRADSVLTDTAAVVKVNPAA